MREIKFAQAINEALDEEMARDETVYVIGEDVAGGKMFGTSGGLIQKYGKERIRDAPISETAIAGSCVGAAIAGLRPIADLMFADFFFICMDEIALKAAKWRFTHGGIQTLPIVFRMPMGGYSHVGAEHSHSPLAPIMHTPGLKIVIPSTPYDAKGLLKTAIRDDNPVCYFEHKRLYGTTGSVPEEEYTIPFGVADVKKEGKDATLVATGLMVSWSLEVADDMENRGISVEVIDPRTLEPLDIDTILTSVRKTGRVVIIDEDTKRCSISCEIAMQIMENSFDALDAPIQRVGAANMPIPGGLAEDLVLPQKKDIVAAIEAVVGRASD